MANKSKGLFDGCLLLSDIDGTLVYKGKIPQRNLDAVKYFMDNGGLFSIATGRSIEATRQYAEKCGCNCGVVTFNGAVVYDYSKEQAIMSRHLPETAKAILNPLMKKFPAVGAEVHNLRELYVMHETDATIDHMEYEKIFATDIPLDEVYKKDWTKVLFGCFDVDELQRMMNYCNSLNTDGCYFLRTADIYLELTCGGVNKGYALGKMAEHYNIERDKVFAVGDYYNDIEMLCEAGLSGVAEAAPDELKEKADVTLCKCENGCVADFINYLRIKLQG